MLLVTASYMTRSLYWGRKVIGDSKAPWVHCMIKCCIKGLHDPFVGGFAFDRGFCMGQTRQRQAYQRRDKAVI